MQRVCSSLPLRSRRSPPARSRRFVPGIEPLEARAIPATFTVSNTLDGGPGSLRQAILDANARAGNDEIHFAIDRGPQTIVVESPLPALRDRVILDGTTQPDYLGAPLIEIHGGMAGAGTDGLVIQADLCTVRGLAINGFGGAGVVLDVYGRNVLEGNYLGTDITGTVAVPNRVGILLTRGTSRNTVGGLKVSAANLIAGNEQSGIEISGDATLNNQILGNYIGTQADGASPLGNGSHGVLLTDGTRGNRVGGTALGAANVIAHNGGAGVAAAAGFHNSVRGNAVFGNASLGIDLGEDGVTPNDAGDGDAGPNDVQNYPDLYGAIAGTTTWVYGYLDSRANTSYWLDFYASPMPDPTGHGQGQRFLGTAVVQTDDTGFVEFTVELDAATVEGEAITATATAHPAEEVIAASNFTFNDEGWRCSDDAESPIPRYFASGGSPDGYIRCRDRQKGDTVRFVAPEKYSGDLSGAYGHELRFSLRARGSGPFTASLVLLRGAGVQLLYRNPSDPRPRDVPWTAYQVPLSAPSFWTLDGRPVTEEEMRAVLADVTLLRVRAEWYNSDDSGDLDTLSLGGSWAGDAPAGNTSEFSAAVSAEPPGGSPAPGEGRRGGRVGRYTGTAAVLQAEETGRAKGHFFLAEVRVNGNVSGEHANRCRTELSRPVPHYPAAIGEGSAPVRQARLKLHAGATDAVFGMAECGEWENL